MANKPSTSSVLPLKRKATSEMEKPVKSVRVDDSDSDSDQPKDEIEAVAKPDIQIFPGFLPNDVTLVVDGKRLHVNKDLLSSASPVFDAWLKKEWQQDECSNDTKQELTFPGKTYDEMATFLKCLLPIFADQVTVATLETVLPLADEYQTDNLLKECEEVIRKHVGSVSERDIYIPPSQVVTYLLWIEQYNMHTAEKCVVRLASFLKTEEVEAVPNYINVSKSLQLDVSNARAKLFESLMVFNVTEAARKMNEFQIPLSTRYMAEWKRNVAEIVDIYLALSTLPRDAFSYKGSVPSLKSLEHIDFSSIRYKEQYKPSSITKDTCKSLRDKFKLSNILSS
ncbi:uncharacterized protein LOC110443564 [Mizuhopecten yessoensis]|uniref:uncharacterized protein LOC110443564 n=1 Tax=Mizuhopecten yessoensis TaxID=6573 RepID=UPI000B4591D0|nr:uncharacterized protein LOC110443564 [Mizuhopecten yessoensis]